MPSSPATLTAVCETARPIIEQVVWCAVATVDKRSKPRVRLMHPVWFWDDEAPYALVTARPTPIKITHLAANPHVSCFYWDPSHHTVAIDARAQWLQADEQVQAWNQIRAVDAHVGFDPIIIWPDGPESPDCVFLRFDPDRILATKAGLTGLSGHVEWGSVSLGLRVEIGDGLHLAWPITKT